MQNTILLADDDTELSGLLKEYFESESFQVRLAPDGLAALEEARKPGLDLIVLDVMMPGTGGALMYKSLKTDRLLKHIPIIMLSAVGQRSFQHYLKMLNIKLAEPLPDPDAYLEKPPDVQHLLDTAVRLMAIRKR